MAGVELNAVVSQRVEVAPGLIILRIVPDGWELPDFVPGQFAVVGLPGSAPRVELADPEDPPPDPDKLIRRSYSIASSSKAKEYLEFYLTIVRSGSLTPRLFALKPGDKVWLGKKFSGLFRLADAPEDVDIVMVATGTGLAPYMSMLRTELRAESKRRVALFHGARHSWDLGYRSELITLKRICPGFDYFPVVSRPDEEVAPWSGQAGYVQDLWKRGVLEQAWGRKPTPEDTHVFLCGNPRMITDMLEILEAEGFKEHSRKAAGQIHVEKYW